MGSNTPRAITIRHDNPHKDRGTVVVLGTPRGGTSVVAGICHMLGAEMGVDIDPSNMEDREFHRILTGEGSISEMPELLRKLHTKRSLAGLKNPIAIDRLHEFLPYVAEAVFVVVLRDAFAVAQREQQGGQEFDGAVRRALLRQSAIFDFAESVHLPICFLSYERLLMDPLSAVAGLANFLLSHVDDVLVKAASELVLPHADMPREVDFVAARRELDLAS